MNGFRVFATGLAALGFAVCAIAQFKGPTPLAWRWANPTAVSPLGSPVVDGDTIFVAVGNRVFALDRQTGNQKWKFPGVEGVPGYFRSAPVLAEGTIMASADNSLIYAMDAATGQSKWQYPSVVPIIGQPVAVGKFLVFMLSDNTLMALNSGDGQVAWGPYRVFNGLNGGLGVFGDSLLYTTQTGELVNMSVNTQKHLWVRRFPVIFNDSAPVTFGQEIFLNNGTWISCLSGNTGTPRWQQNVGEQLIFSPAVSPAGCFVESVEGRAFVFDSGTGRPMLRQAVDLKSSAAVRPSPVDGFFIAPTANGALNLIDPKSGEVVWSYLVRPLIGATSASAAGGEAGGLGGLGGVGGGGAGRGGRQTGRQQDAPILAVPASGPAILADQTLLVLIQDGSLLAFDPRYGVDKTGPTVRMVWPSPGDQVSGQSLELVFKIDDEATGVNEKTLKVAIGGQELDFEYGRDGYAIANISVASKNKPLSDGRKEIKVTATDYMGNTTETTYAISVDNSLTPVSRSADVGPRQGRGRGSKGGG